MKDEFERRPVPNAMVVVAGSMAVSGASLAVGALGARVFFERGSLGASLFVAITDLLAAIAVGRALHPAAMLRFFPGLARQLSYVDRDPQADRREHA